jgi:hypothetical protein
LPEAWQRPHHMAVSADRGANHDSTGNIRRTDGREFAARLGLTPRPSSSGGKERLGRISKMRGGYLRTLLVVGATAVIRYAQTKTAANTAWINSLLTRKPARLVSVALANKTARIAWALLAIREVYRSDLSQQFVSKFQLLLPRLKDGG